MNKKEKNSKIPYLIVSICFIYLAIVMYIFKNPFVYSYTLEAGKQLTVKQLLKEEVEASFLTKIDDSIIRKVGEHEVRVKAKGGTYSVIVNTVDTIAPQGKVIKKNIWLNDPLKADELVKNIKDETEVKVSFLNKVNTKKLGKQEVTLQLEDMGGNTTKYKTTINIKKDTEGPVITTPQSFTVQKGDSIFYKKGVKVVDNRDGVITHFDVDTSKVNLNKIGNYIATYIAKDSLNNVTKKNVQVRVVSYDLAKVKKELDSRSDKILKKLINSNMSKAKKLEKIYDYVQNNYIYQATHEGTIDDFYIDALNGFKTGRGDCYVVNAMVRYLLEKCDIETYGLVIKGKTTDHISFMANTGDGWYHYSAFKKKSGLRLFKWTDAQIFNHYKNVDGVTQLEKGNLPDTPK